MENTENNSTEEVIENNVGDEQPKVTLPSDTPEFVMPNKFDGKSAEEIAKAYVNLEKMHSKKETEANTEAPAGEVTPPLELVEEYMSKATDGLTAEHYSELEAKGYSKEQVDTYAKGVEANIREQGLQVLTNIGTTEAEYNEATEWAKTNWSEDRTARFNKALENATADTLPVLLEGALTEFRGARVPNAKITQTTSIQGSDNNQTGYKNKYELQEDMKDRRYGRDRSYTQMVERKVSVTPNSVL